MVQGGGATSSRMPKYSARSAQGVVGIGKERPNTNQSNYKCYLLIRSRSISHPKLDIDVCCHVFISLLFFLIDNSFVDITDEVYHKNNDKSREAHNSISQSGIERLYFRSKLS